MEVNGEKGTHNLIIRLTPSQHKRIKAMAVASGFNTISAFVRNQILNPSIEMKLNHIVSLLEEGENKHGKKFLKEVREKNS